MKILGIPCHMLKLAALKFISLVTYNLSGKPARNKKVLAELKDKYKGKRCFIVCNGTSLKDSDLDVLHKNNELTFASNKIDKIFNQTDIIRIYAEPFSNNIGSRKVLEKAGFQLEGIMKNNAIKNGKVQDMAMYSYTRDLK